MGRAQVRFAERLLHARNIGRRESSDRETKTGGIGVTRGRWLLRSIGLAFALALFAGCCGCRESIAVLPEKPSEDYEFALPYRSEGRGTVFGPFSSWVRGVDWFWHRDGKSLVVTAEQEGSGRLWVIDAPTSQSWLLRDVPGAQAIFPVGWLGLDELVCIELPSGRDQVTNVTVTDISGRGSRTVGGLDGRLLRHEMTSDGRFLAVHANTQDGGTIIRFDVSEGSSVDVATGLPIWDGLFPVWFSPGGLHAAMPEYDGDGKYRLLVLELASGQMQPVTPYLELIGPAFWAPGGERLAYKVADGQHEILETEAMSDILSPKVRVLTADGGLVDEFMVPEGHLVRDVIWLDGETLLLGTATGTQGWGLAFQARIGGAVEPADPDQQRILEEGVSRPYPMAKGSSESYRVETRHWQDEGKAPCEELVIIPND